MSYGPTEINSSNSNNYHVSDYQSSGKLNNRTYTFLDVLSAAGNAIGSFFKWLFSCLFPVENSSTNKINNLENRATISARPGPRKPTDSIASSQVVKTFTQAPISKPQASVNQSEDSSKKALELTEKYSKYCEDLHDLELLLIDDKLQPTEKAKFIASTKTTRTEIKEIRTWYKGLSPETKNSQPLQQLKDVVGQCQRIIKRLNNKIKSNEALGLKPEVTKNASPSLIKFIQEETKEFSKYTKGLLALEVTIMKKTVFDKIDKEGFEMAIEIAHNAISTTNIKLKKLSLDTQNLKSFKALENEMQYVKAILNNLTQMISKK